MMKENFFQNYKENIFKVFFFYCFYYYYEHREVFFPRTFLKIVQVHLQSFRSLKFLSVNIFFFFYL